MAQYWAAFRESFPFTATAFGADAARDQLDDLRNEALSNWVATIDKHLEALAGINRGALSDENMEHFQAFEWMLRSERAHFDHNSRFLTFTTMGGWHTDVPDIVLSMPYRAEEDFRDLIKLLSGVGAYADQNIALLRQGISTGFTQPCATLNGYQDTINSYTSELPGDSAFAEPFQQFPETLSQELQDELRKEAMQVIATVVDPAYRRFATFFEKEYLPACRAKIGLGALPGGPAAYAALLRYYTSLDVHADAVHELGLREVARIRAAMQGVIDAVGFEGDFADFLEFLRTDAQFYATDEQSYLDRVAWVAKSIDGRLPLFFSRLPANPYGINAIPEATAERSAAGYYQPGAADGSRAGQVYVNTYDLSSRPLYEIVALMLHEGVPGHHLQFSFQSESQDTPDWRRFYYFQAYGEGWGLYSEWLGQEMGMYNTPYERFGRMILEIWRAARLVVDTGIHAQGWSRQRAIDYMLTNTGLSRQNIVAEVDRYITLPGQAVAYKYGELKIRELRQRAEQFLGADFDARTFHVAVLEGGALPLAVLEVKIDKWLAQQEVQTDQSR
ncbi:MAG: DUF885 domain-containing protein [Halioglobus sp.]|nr:DUF885 domain-containing protein [Halioglobus sp.]